MEDRGGETLFLHPNPLLSTTIETYYNGGVASDVLFYPWGQVWDHAEVVDFQWAGTLYMDGNPPVDYMTYRLYGGNLSRWITPDPLGGEISNPQSLNRYSYALNNPTTLTDPLGLDPSDCYPVTDQFGNTTVVCNEPDTVTVNGGSPPDVPIMIGPCSYEAIQMAACYGGSSPAPPGWYPGWSGGNGGGAPAPAPKPAPPKPDVPLNPFATAVFHRVYCGTQFLDRLPSVKGGGLFGFGGLEFQVPIVPVKGEALGIMNYDTRAGFSTGALVGTSSSNTIGPGGAVERSYNWSAGKWESEGLGFFGAETEDVNAGAVGGGLLFGTQGAVGFYGQVGSFGGGGYLNVSYGACQ